MFEKIGIAALWLLLVASIMFAVLGGSLVQLARVGAAFQLPM